ncbi:hypothetical protein [Candidatus Pandoraea novymonadis]|uniref:Uncharacterized protein n=1 Tax=Candidatus Pandoraea novymonadis TaxID=1808959 RepID=A0ABX5FFW3_9BURK|nr:hypothetical protein [Candidatus Pandoraea novymonadis]PSB92340.1 hypothetical protein BZL35_00580 [Candidatus Pandoraea novymonadis]
MRFPNKLVAAGGSILCRFEILQRVEMPEQLGGKNEAARRFLLNVTDIVIYLKTDYKNTPV